MRRRRPSAGGAISAMDGGDDAGLRVPFHGAPAGEHFVENETERENVAAAVDFYAGGRELELFRGDVVKRAQNFVVTREREGESDILRGRLGRREFGEAEVEEHGAGFGYEDIGRFQFTVNDALFYGRRQGRRRFGWRSGGPSPGTQGPWSGAPSRYSMTR